MQIFRNLGIVIGGFFGAAADSSDDFLTQFKLVTDEWAAWVRSIEGKNSIKNTFDEAVPVIKEVWGLLGDIAGLFTESFTGDTGNLTGFIQTIRREVIPGIEAFQDTLRESGIQDALWKFGDALLGLFQAGGGAAFKIFVETLTLFVEVIGDLTEALGPLLTPLATFFGIFKAMTIAKSAFSGLFGLPGMLGATVTPATRAATAVGAANTALSGAGIAGAAGSAGKIGKLAGAFGALSRAAGPIALALAGTWAATKALEADIPNSTKRVNEFADSLGKGLSAAGTLERAKFSNGIDFIPDIGPQASGLQRILGDLDTGISASVNRWGADFLHMDPAGINQSRAALEDMFLAIQQYATDTGDVTGAEKALANLRGELEKGDVALSEYEDSAKTTAGVISELKTAAGGAFEGGGIGIVGDFTNQKSALETLGQSFDQNITTKLDAIRANRAKYGDPLTGGLNAAGIKAVVDVYKKANTDMVGGIDNALTKEDAAWVRRLYSTKKNLDENGNLTEAAMEKLANFLPEAVKRGLPGLEKQRQDVAKLFTDIPFSFRSDVSVLELPERIQSRLREVGDIATRLYLEPGTYDKMDNDIKAAFGRKIYDLRARLEAEGLSEEEIQAELDKQAYTLYLQAETDDAKADLEALIGPGWETVVKAQMAEAGPGSLLDINGTLVEFTEDGKWEAVVGAEADTARAEGDFRTLVEGPGGTWTAEIVTETDTSEATYKLTNLGTKRNPHWVYTETKTDTKEAQYKLINLGTKKNPRIIWTQVKFLSPKGEPMSSPYYLTKPENRPGG